jgi:hypothetical protein
MSTVKDGVDILAQFVQERADEAELREKELQKNKGKRRKPKSPILCESDDEEDDIVTKRRKNKYQSPEYILILDDMSNELKTKTIQKLLKENRHYALKCIISSQHLKDMKPESRKQIDFYLLFKNQPQQILEIVHSDSSSKLTEAQFNEVYNAATNEPYSFLYIDTTLNKYRKNFNTEISIE